MYVFAKIVLIVLAIIAFFEGVGAYSQAKAITHQMYAGLWFVVFSVSLGTAGIISALTREVEAMAELKSFLQRIKNRAAPKQAAAEAVDETRVVAKPEQTKPVPGPGREQIASRQCPYCGADVQVDATNCSKCTRILNQYVPCPKCKTDISHRPSECPGCGSKINWRSASDSTK
jgi:predicted RNA-binding Zn-ribbon protein involved in translation (DUF1610 family)